MSVNDHFEINCVPLSIEVTQQFATIFFPDFEDANAINRIFVQLMAFYFHETSTEGWSCNCIKHYEPMFNFHAEPKPNVDQASSDTSSLQSNRPNERESLLSKPLFASELRDLSCLCIEGRRMSQFRMILKKWEFVLQLGEPLFMSRYDLNYFTEPYSWYSDPEHNFVYQLQIWQRQGYYPRFASVSYHRTSGGIPQVCLRWCPYKDQLFS